MGMEIGRIRTTDSMAGTQRAAAQPADAVSKGIQDEISDIERQRQGLSSKEGMSAEEKVKKRQELQQELSSLNTKLRQRQAEVRKEQQREARREELRTEATGGEDAKKGKKPDGAGSVNKTGGRAQNTDDKAADARGAEKKAEKVSAVQEKGKKTSGVKGAKKAVAGVEKAKENKATGLQSKEQNTYGIGETKKGATGVQGGDKKNGEAKPADKKNKGAELEDIAMPEAKMRKLMAADSAKEQKKRQEIVIARIENDIVILKGEIKQDELRGVDTEQKKAQLKRQEEKVLQASSGIPTMGKSKEDKSSEPIGEKVKVRVDGAQKSSGADTAKDSGDGIVIAAADLSKNLFQ